ncbi:MAG: hypothetical protein ACK4KT_08005, partial [Thermaurantimonas sp.]
PSADFKIKLQGRTIGETALIVVENHTLIGYGYFRLHHEIQKFDAFRKTLTPVNEDGYILGLIASWIQRHPDTVMLMPFNSGASQFIPASESASEQEPDTFD